MDVNTVHDKVALSRFEHLMFNEFLPGKLWLGNNITFDVDLVNFNLVSIRNSLSRNDLFVSEPLPFGFGCGTKVEFLNSLSQPLHEFNIVASDIYNPISELEFPDYGRRLYTGIKKIKLTNYWYMIGGIPLETGKAKVQAFVEIYYISRQI